MDGKVGGKGWNRENSVVGWWYGRQESGVLREPGRYRKVGRDGVSQGRQEVPGRVCTVLERVQRGEVGVKGGTVYDKEGEDLKEGPVDRVA